MIFDKRNILRAIFVKKFVPYKKIIALLLLFPVLISVPGCQKSNQPMTYTDYYFNTVISLTFYSADDCALAEECFALCEKYENLLSRTVEGSDIWRINHSNGEPVSVSSETYNLLEQALYYCELTEGKIDITVAPLMDLWNFTEATDETVPPSSAEINALLEHVDYRLVELGENNTVTLKDPDSAIDLGFIAKGFIADQIKDYLISQGVTSALINLGGNVCAIGNKPDGSAYTIGIQQPFAAAGTTSDVVQVTNSSVVTSGTYERYFTYENVIYHHILDATTGYPVENELTGITIICDSSATADALSTTCFVLGPEDALKYIETLDNTECILINVSGQITYSYK